jgi:hypothetical protein
MRKTVDSLSGELAGYPFDSVSVSVERREVWDGQEETSVVDVTIGTGETSATATLLQEDADALADALRGDER